MTQPNNPLLNPFITYIIGLIFGGLWIYSFMKIK